MENCVNVHSNDSDEMVKVLSIQSHVVSGYAGNKCAVFPLQIHGFEVDMINTVQYSNHLGHPHWRGQKLRAQDFKELYEGLKLCKLTDYTYLITGYVPDEPLLLEIASMVTSIRLQNPKLLYVCDPVMGDCGKFYVSSTLLNVYKEKLLPLANVITPNQFELEKLSGVTIKSEESALRAMSALFSDTLRQIVLTSVDFGNSGETISGYFGERDESGKVSFFGFQVDHFAAHFVGTGDVFTSLLLVWLHKTGSLETAVINAQSSLQAVLKRTLSYANKVNATDDKYAMVKRLELRIIQSMEDLLSPKESVNVNRLQ